MKDRGATTHFVLLDGLRGIAAAAVVIMHIADQYAHGVLEHGYLAVPFFFTLSGFVIAYAYEDGLMRRGTAFEFLKVRLERLYPLLLAGIGLGVGLLVSAYLLGSDRAHLNRLPLMFGAALLMFPLEGAPNFPLLAPQWSLAIEIYGNMLHFGLRRWMSLRALFWALPVLLAAMILGAAEFGGLGTGWSIANMWAGIAAFLFCYALGILLYRLWRLDRLPRIRLPVWVIVLLLIATFAVPQTLRTSPNAVRDMACALFVYPLLLIAALGARMGPVEARIAHWLGRLSYPLYITHFPIALAGAGLVLRLRLSPTAQYVSIPLIFLIAVAAAWALLVLYDEPLRARLKSVRHARAAIEPSAGPV